MTGALLVLLVAGLLSILIYQAKTGVAPVPSTPGEIATVVALLREARYADAHAL